ncbi:MULTISPECIES: mechanosensitive ion channel family protein [unclassified Colwellia]|jgi:small-conductance mechanosensitive channel|uniref:mechanosensitive ion channel family protein n=1 Tax=unclassified Colwellia TaxID=196834 RepID=UPI000D3462A0|nr:MULTISPECIES: mechanosensitive ion channel family protein [unclassified Colwellia]AWB58158.1 mechanosensitive ion channel protein MscS [Colwellia sp. Arc7-D]MBA6416534.1 mechanosensitive ion channel family protein [Colwellia sp. 6M3]|tara:strand:+ start:228 stop:1109 length:882 start_codon:yes stop_codon:yes gene_type:complete
MEPLNILVTQLREIARGAIEVMPQLLIALVIILLTYAFAKLARNIAQRILKKTKLRKSLINLLILFSSIAIWIIGIMIAAIIAFPGLTPTKMLAGLGIGSVAIGFAFKDIFENFLAGIIILLRKEMRINDFIACEGYEGTVEAILVRETHIRQPDGELVILPNSILFKNPLTIRTDLDQRRTTIICGVGYGENVDEARSVIKQAVTDCKTVISDSRPVQIFANEFADSSINFEVTWWTGSKPVNIRESRDEVVAAVKSALDKSGIEIPFPYRTLTFNQPISVNTDQKQDDTTE